MIKYAGRAMHPRPVSVIISRSRSGNVNGCAVAWFMPVNVDPFIFAASISPKRLTYDYIRESGEITLNMVPLKMVEAVHRVGSLSGRDIVDKLTKFGFELEPSLKVSVPHVKGAPAYIEGLLRSELRFSDHSLMIFDGVHVYVDDKCFRDNMFSEGTEILLHVGGNVYTKPGEYVKID